MICTVCWMFEMRSSVTDGPTAMVPVSVTLAFARSRVVFRRLLLNKRDNEKPCPDLAGAAVKCIAMAPAATKATTIRNSRLPMD
jgi:hypothetical protein